MPGQIWNYAPLIVFWGWLPDQWLFNSWGFFVAHPLPVRLPHILLDPALPLREWRRPNSISQRFVLADESPKDGETHKSSGATRRSQRAKGQERKSTKAYHTATALRKSFARYHETREIDCSWHQQQGQIQDKIFDSLF
jgi:hypothetical protein